MTISSKLCPWLVATFGRKGTKPSGMKSPGWPQNFPLGRNIPTLDIRLSGGCLGLSPEGFYDHGNHGTVGKEFM